MSEEPTGGGTGGGYRRNWVRYLIIYLLVGGVAYAAIWYFFIKDGGYGG
ncbi:MAG TPA: hypothetical protein VHI54_03205 [Actinomycetota bacterium]|nr:hypothetical protein [Actinomycetota bacterium]